MNSDFDFTVINVRKMWNLPFHNHMKNHKMYTFFFITSIICMNRKPNTPWQSDYSRCIFWIIEILCKQF